MSAFGCIVLAAAVAGTLDVSDRTELRVRDSNEAVGRVMDLETAPAARLRLRAPTWEFTTSYSPRLTLRQVEVEPRPEALQHGTLDLSRRFRRGELAAHGDFMYGTLTFTSLAPDLAAASPVSPIERLPGPLLITYGAARIGASWRFAATRRWVLTGLFEYTLSGGVGERSIAVMPFQSGPHAALGAERALSRNDRLVSTLDGSRAMFSTGSDQTVVELEEVWRHAFDSRTASTLSGGAAGVIGRERSRAPLGYRAFPVAEAAVTHGRAPDPLTARIGVRLAPVVDRLTGLVDERLQGTFALSWAPVRAITVRGQAGVAQSVPWTGEDAITLVLGEAAVTTRLGDRVSLEAGTRSAWQGLRGASMLPPEWVVFAAATVALPSLRY